MVVQCLSFVVWCLRYHKRDTTNNNNNNNIKNASKRSQKICEIKNDVFFFVDHGNTRTTIIIPYFMSFGGREGDMVHARTVHYYVLYSVFEYQHLVSVLRRGFFSKRIARWLSHLSLC